MGLVEYLLIIKKKWYTVLAGGVLYLWFTLQAWVEIALPWWGSMSSEKKKNIYIYIYIYKIAIRLVLKQLIDKVRPVEMRIWGKVTWDGLVIFRVERLMC